MEQLIFSVASDTRTTPDIILEIIPMMSEFYEKELNFRNQLKVRFGLHFTLGRKTTISRIQEGQK